MKDLNERDLIESVSHDGRNAFDLFYNTYYDRVFRFSYYYLKDKEACREVVSNVFFSVWQARKTLKDIRNIEAWLHIITKNESTRYLKREYDNNFVSLDDIKLHVSECSTESPEDKMLHEEMEELLTKAINQLPDRCKMIFIMSRLEGYKPKQIAEILSINESTVRVQLKIAIGKIINAINPNFPDVSFSIFLVYICCKFMY